MQLSIVEVLGYYKYPTGPQGLIFKLPFYDIRQNNNYAFNSLMPLGLQVKVAYLGEMMWINISENWIYPQIPHIVL